MSPSGETTHLLVGKDHTATAGGTRKTKLINDNWISKAGTKYDSGWQQTIDDHTLDRSDCHCDG